MAKLHQITLKLDQLGSTGEFLARALASQDQSWSQSSTLILTLAEDVREEVLQLIQSLERSIEEIATETQLH